MSRKVITICSSASFYKQALAIADGLQKRGFRVLLPHNAKLMKKNNSYRAAEYKTWIKNPEDYPKKARLIRRHFAEIIKGDAILVINLNKKGMDGYIGGNVLMEMALAFHMDKPIFIWNKVSSRLPVYEEVMGMLPVFINNDLSKLKKICS